MEQQEVELLRQRVTFLEEMLDRCLEQMRALESRVAMVEGRSGALLTEEMVARLASEVSDLLTDRGDPPQGPTRRVVE